jgi:hypothetical protein
MLAESLPRFIDDTDDIYGAVRKNPASMTPETQDKIQKLASRTEVLKTALQQTKQGLSNDLHDQLS